MRDLPIENVDDETFETWRAHPGTDALLKSIAMVRARFAGLLIGAATSGSEVKPVTTAFAGGQIFILEELTAIISGETREKKNASKEGS
jgi:hypothetical protein